MKVNDFRKNAHDVVNWMADYLETVEEQRVRAQVEPGSISAMLPLEAPQNGEDFDDIFGDFRDLIVPGMTHWQHPSFFAYFNANSSPPSVLAEMLTATLGAQCMSWETSPAATELEQRVMEWLRKMVGLPDGFVGSIQDSASTATFEALIVARERATGFAIADQGLSGHPSPMAYCSEEAHSSVEKAVRLLGWGRANLRKIQVDENFAMDTHALERAILEDRGAGRPPACVVATLGTTGVGGIDSIRKIGQVTQRHGVWLHVDAAWAGSALVLPEFRHMIDGIDAVDSLVLNPHKWLFTNFDCTVLFVRDVESFLRVFSLTPEYLRTRRDAQVTNYRDWGIQLGRRFRALKLWFVLRSYGTVGLQRMLREHIRLATELAAKISAVEDFELVVPPSISLFCFRYARRGCSTEEIDDLNERLLQAVNDSGRLYVTHTHVKGRFVIRFVVGQTYTEQKHVDRAWRTLCDTARSL